MGMWDELVELAGGQSNRCLVEQAPQCAHRRGEKGCDSVRLVEKS
jgi:hypothetical protein